MATYYSGYSNTYRLVLELTESLPSGYIADNETTVNFTLKVSCGASYAQWNPGPGDFTVAINGSTALSSNNPKFWFTGANQTITIGSGSVSVPHNSDGTKTVSFSANYKAESTASYLPNSMSLSGSMALTTIPRASSISSISNDGLTINGSNALTVNISRASSSFTHDVTFTFGSYSQKLTGQGTSAALTIPLSWIGRFGNGGKGSLTGTVTVQTKSGTTNIGSAVSKGFTLYCPNASSISSATASIVCNGSNTIAVNISRSISSFTHTVKWTFGSYTNSKTGQGTSSSYAPPTSWLAAISAANSGTGSVSVTTYYGSQQIGDVASKAFTMTVPDYTPSLSSVSVALVQDSKISDWNIYVQNFSKAKFAFNGASGGYSSTIEEYKVVLDGVTYEGTGTSYTSNVITGTGSLSWTATITDSRGKTNSKSGTISVSKKIAPSYVSAVIGRYDGSKINDEGTQLYFKFTYDYETYGGLNSTVNKLSYKNVEDDYYIEYGTFTSGTALIIDDVTFDDKEAYKLFIEVTDELGGNITRYVDIPTASALIDADGPNNALGLLRMASKANTVQVGGALETTGGIDSESTIRAKSALISNGGVVELFGATPYIDFHYGNDSGDYTSRLIANGENKLTCTSDFAISGVLSVGGKSFVDLIYPVGSIYISVNSTNPADLFGGTWEQLKDRFLVGAGSSYTNGATGGATSHTHTNPTTGSTTLTVNQIPSHTHSGIPTINPNYSMQGGGTDVNYHILNSTTRATSTYATGGGQGHTHTMGNTGSSSNLPPYLAVYMWKRTA